MSKKIVIFDLDGTLIDSSVNITRAVNFVRLNLSLEPLSKEFITSNINRDDINPSKVFYNSDRFEPEHRELFETFYMDICDEAVEIYERIPQMLEHLKSKGFLLSVATNGASKFAERILSTLELDGFFENIIGADMVDRPKPFPDMLEMVLSMCGYNKECDHVPFMVGDSIKDVLAAKRANMRSAFVKWGFTDSVDGAHIELECASDLEKLQNYFKERL